MTAIPGRRDRRRAETRARLVSVARERFVAEGFDAVSIESLAHAAGVSRRTFFRYFPTKDAVVFADNSARLAHFEALVEAGSGAAWARVRAGLLSLAEAFEADRDALLAWHRVVQGSSLLLARDLEQDMRWEAVIAHALGDAGGPAGRRARVVAGMTMGAVRATLRGWYAGGCRAPLVPLAIEALDLIEGGTRTLHGEAP
jgi:AcrR family transcriptional regulator